MMAEEQDRAWVPDDHGAAAIPAVACLRMEWYAIIILYFLCNTAESNSNIFKIFKYL